MNKLITENKRFTPLKKVLFLLQEIGLLLFRLVRIFNQFKLRFVLSRTFLVFVTIFFLSTSSTFANTNLKQQDSNFFVKAFSEGIGEFVQGSISMVNDFGHFFSSALSGFNEIAEITVDASADLYGDLFQKSAGVTANVFNGFKVFSQTTVNASEDVGNAIAEKIISVSESVANLSDKGSKFALRSFEEMKLGNSLTASVSKESNVWNRFINKISNSLVPLFFVKPENIEVPVKNNNQIKFPANEENNFPIVVTPKKEQVIERTVFSGLTRFELDSSISDLRNELIELNIQTAKRLDDMRRRQAEKIGDSTSDSIQNAIENITVTSSTDLSTLTVDTNTLVVDEENNRVGIATTTPFATLSIAGDLALTGGLYDSNATLGTDGYVLQTTGTGVEWVATSTLGISGGGGSSQWTTSGSDVYYNTGKVGIGIAGPTAKLHIKGGGTTTGTLLSLVDSANTSRLSILDNGTTVFSGGVTATSFTGRSFLSTDGVDGAILETNQTDDGAGLYQYGLGTEIAVYNQGEYIYGDGSMRVDGSTGISYFNNGAVGIGTTSPYAKLSVAGQVVGAYFTATTSTVSTFPYASTTALTVSGTNGLQLASALNGPLQVNAGLVSATTSIGVLYGGTGLTTAPTYGQMLVGNSSGGYTLTATSSLGITTSFGIGTSITSGTAGSVLFVGSGGLAQDNANFFWDQTNSRLGIGTTTPSSKLALAGGNFTHTAYGNPTLSGTYNTTGNSYDVFISGKYAYVADVASGLQIIDISNPASPTLSGTYNTSGAAYGVYVSGKYAYVADQASGLHIIDVSNSASPTLVGTYNTSGSASKVYVSGKYAYVADDTSGLQIIDISNPTSPVLTGTYNTAGNSYDIYVSGKYAYLADSDTGIQIFDISNPVSPTLMGVYNTSGFAYGVYVSGKYAYVADVTSGLQIINVSNPASPTLSGTYNTTGNAVNVKVSGKYAYVSDSADGVQIIDVSNSTSPTLIGTYNTSGLAEAVYVSGKYVYVADDTSGLQILDINGIETPSLYAGNIETNVLNATENIISGGDIYAQGGLNVGISGIFSRGGLGVFVASTTAANPIAASFMGGAVGIGTPSPYSKLSVWGSGTGTGQLFSLVNNASSTIFQALDNGNIGIGTSSPYAKLSVVGQVAGEYFTATSTTATSTFNGGLTVDGSTLVVDYSTNKVGVGTASPSAFLHIVGTTEQQRVGYDSSNYFKTTVGSNGLTTFDAVGSGAGFTFSDLITGSAGLAVNGDTITDFTGTGLSLVGNALTVSGFYSQGSTILATVGTASDPGLSFASYSGTGIYSDGYNSILFSSGTSPKGGFDGQSGDFYIGTSGLANSNFTVNSNGEINSTVDGDVNITDNLNISGTYYIGGVSGTTVDNCFDGDFTGGILTNCDSSSDNRLKTDLVPIEDAVEKIGLLNGYRFNWNSTWQSFHPNSSSTPQIGLIAQDVESVFPELVGEDSNGYKTLNYPKLIAVVVEAIKELADSLKKIALWFTGDKFTVQGDVCVDDVCVSKEQFKALLINASQNESDISSPDTESEPDASSVVSPEEPEVEGEVQTSTSEEVMVPEVEQPSSQEIEIPTVEEVVTPLESKNVEDPSVSQDTEDSPPPSEAPQDSVE